MLFLALLALVLGCSDNKVSRVHIKLEDLPQEKKLPPNEPTPVLPPAICPSAGVMPLNAMAPHTGHHKVFLKWNASKPSKDDSNEVVGYCLYRSTEKKVAKKDPKCPKCEQVNRVPIKETQCVDDLVTDGTTYYYVATAITRKSGLSTTSNEIPVKIPRSERPIGHAPADSYPSCRAAAPDKVSPGNR